jgi:NAD-dependent deacetylase
VLEFYNQRRRQLLSCEPNEAHKIIASLEEDFDVTVITQNVDDLHERAGSTKVIHLHGELLKACSSRDKEQSLPWTGDINIGDKHEDGSQLRPYIVWFGENVPLMNSAEREAQTADIFVVVGTSLQVYPAAGLADCTKVWCKNYYIDPSPAEEKMLDSFTIIPKVATQGMKDLAHLLKTSI